MKSTATVYVIPGMVTRGHWCDRCNQSTVTEYKLYAVRDLEGAGSAVLGQVRECVNCDRED